MNINDQFPSKYLAASDLKGNPVQVTIARCQTEEVGQKKDQRPVVYFEGGKKGMVLNKTNAKRIAAAHGQETESWAGKVIELYPTVTEFEGEPKDCIRVRMPQDAPAAQTAPAAPEQGSGVFTDGPAGREEDDLPF